MLELLGIHFLKCFGDRALIEGLRDGVTTNVTLFENERVRR